MILVAAALGGLAFICMVYRRTLLGLLVGAQILTLAVSLAFVVAGASSGTLLKGHVFGLLLSLSGVAQLAVGFALAVRLFYLRRRADMGDVRSLRH